MDIDTRLLRYFIALAEERNVTRAASTLLLTQQALSSQLRRLEHLVGCELFLRTPRGLELTKAGAEILPDAQAIVARVDRFLSRAAGELRPLVIPEIRGPGALQLVLDRYLEKIPGTLVHISDFSGHDQLAALLRGELDVAISQMRETLPSLRSTLLRYDPVMIATLASHGEIALTQDRIGLPSAHFAGWYEFFEELEADLDVEFVRLPLEVTAGHAVVHSLSQQESIPVVVLSGMQDYLYRAGLAFHAPVDVQPYYPWSIVWREDDVDPRIARFVDSARAVARHQRWLHPVPGGQVRPWFPVQATV